jgi:tetratricopeptide (TPR) repeat protein
MTKVFLSYDREDQAAARKIAASLQKAGHEVWWDRNIRGGSEYAQEIERALQDAGAVVVLWSERSTKSAWVRDEAAAGRDSGRLVPVRIDACSPPLGFRQYQLIDLPNALKPRARTDFTALADAVANVTGAPPLETAYQERGDARTRRNFLIGAGAVTVVAAGVGGLYLARRSKAADDVPHEVAPLLLQAKQLMNQNTREGQYQAIGLLQRATQLAPKYADGWGWLGYAYGVISHYRERAESLVARSKAEAAGRHALELDAHSDMGELALAVACPFVGYWQQREQHMLKALASDPDDDVLLTMGVILQFDGRSTEAVPYYQKLKHSPLTPAEYTNYIQALWSAGRLAELDQAITDSAALYPTQASLWFTRAKLAMYAGQVNALGALAEDPQARPDGVDDKDIVGMKRFAAAVQSRDPSEVQALMGDNLKQARRSASQAENGIRAASALGRVDDAFTMADAYYFSRGFAVPDFPSSTGASLDQRQTRLLFEPVTKPMRADRRFEKLVKDLGYDRYWKRSGHPPDYRHIAGL